MIDFNIPSPLRVPILREDLLTLIASNLVKPVWYKITDALGGTIPIYVVGELTNTLRGTAIKEDVSGASYQYGTYTIGTTGNNDDVFTAQGSDGILYGVATGTDNYTVNLPVPPHVVGTAFFIEFTNANTGAVTVNIDGLGAIVLYKKGTQNLVLGDILADQVLLIVYDGSDFQAIGIVGSSGGSVASVTGDSVDNTDPANPVVNAIPLSGTTGGNPVTGDIEIDQAFSGNLIYQDDGAGNVASLEFVAGGVAIRNVDASGDAVVSANAGGEAFLGTIDPSTNRAYFKTLVNTFSDAATYPVINEINSKRIQYEGQAAPTVNDDNTVGYAVDSTWVYNGAIYVCTDASTGAAVWVSSGGAPVIPIISLTRAALQALIAGSTLDTTVTYRVTDAVGSTIVVDTWAATSNTLHAVMIDQTNTRFGFYNIVGDAFTEVYIPAIASAAQGDVIYRDGSGSWTRLPAGTSWNQLTTGGSGANPVWALPIPCVDAGGTVDAITADFSPNITLQDNLIIAVVASGANTSATPTLNPDGLGAGTIVKYGGQPLQAGDIPAAQFVGLYRYDAGNTRWELLNPSDALTWVDWSASDNVTGFSSISTNNFRYAYDQFRKKLEITGRIIGVSDATGFTFDLPVAAANTFNQHIAAKIQNNGVVTIGYIFTAINGVTMQARTGSGGTFTASGTKEVSFSMTIQTV